MKKLVTIALAAVALGLVGNAASASILGDEVGLTVVLNPGTMAEITVLQTMVTVEGETEIADFAIDGLLLSIDLDGDSVLWTLENTTLAPVNLPRIELNVLDLDWLPDPGEVGNAFVAANLDDLDVSLTNTTDSIRLVVEPFTIMEEGTTALGVNFDARHDEDPVVPEPATMALMGLGLAGLAVRARRRVA